MSAERIVIIDVHNAKNRNEMTKIHMKSCAHISMFMSWSETSQGDLNINYPILTFFFSLSASIEMQESEWNAFDFARSNLIS